MRVLVAALVLGLCAVCTSARLQDWRSDEALWRSAAVVASASPRPALNLAVALQRRSADVDAAAWAQRAARLADTRSDVVAGGKAHQLLTWIALTSPSLCVSSAPC